MSSPEAPETSTTSDLVARVLAIRRGELPADAVTIEELRAAVAAQRKRFTESEAPASTATPRAARKKTVDVDSLFGSSDFSLFD